MKKLNNTKTKDLPIIQVGKITEHKNGSASYEIFYEDDLVLMIKDSLKLSKNPTKKQINKFLLDALEETMDRMDEEEKELCKK